MFGRIDRAVRAALNDATRAVSIHNSQPWRFVVSESSVQVWLDASRGPRIVDPVGRWAVQSIGAAVANLELALAVRLDTRVTVEVFSDVDPDVDFGVAQNGDAAAADGPTTAGRDSSAWRRLTSRPLAVVHWSGRQDPGPDAEAMFGAIDHRFTSRAPFATATLSERQWRALHSAADVGGIVTDRTSDAFTEFFIALTAKTDARMVDDPAYLAELQQWVDRSRYDGIPATAAGVHDRSGQFPGRDFSLGTSHVTTILAAADFELMPQLAVLHSNSADGPTRWFYAGMALERLALRATSLGLRIGILGQVIEDDEAREQAAGEFQSAAGLSGPTTLHQVVRLGYGDGTPRPAATPRRPLAEVIGNQLAGSATAVG